MMGIENAGCRIMELTSPFCKGCRSNYVCSLHLSSIICYHHLSFYHWNFIASPHSAQFKHTPAMQTRHMMYVAVPMPAQASTSDSLGYGARMTISSWNLKCTVWFMIGKRKIIESFGTFSIQQHLKYHQIISYQKRKVNQWSKKDLRLIDIDIDMIWMNRFMIWFDMIWWW